MKEPKFKLGQKVWITPYSVRDKKMLPKKDTVTAVSLLASDKFGYELSNFSNTWKGEEYLFSTKEEAIKYAAVGNIAERVDQTQWDIHNLNNDIRCLEEILAKSPGALKKKRTALKRAETKLAKLKKQLEEMS